MAFSNIGPSLSRLHGGGEGQVALCLWNEWGSRRAERLSDLYKSHRGQGLCVNRTQPPNFQSRALSTKPPFHCRQLWMLEEKCSVSAFQVEKWKSEVAHGENLFQFGWMLQNHLPFYLFILEHHTSSSTQIVLHHRRCGQLELAGSRGSTNEWHHTATPVFLSLFLTPVPESTCPRDRPIQTRRSACSVSPRVTLHLIPVVVLLPDQCRLCCATTLRAKNCRKCHIWGFHPGWACVALHSVFLFGCKVS